jgi:7-carboxy-7-deazaguanine synthase
MSISPKLSNSTPVPGRVTSAEADRLAARHDARRHRPDVLRRLIREYDYQLKFVIDAPPDVAEVEEWLREFPEVPPARVYLMPQAIERGALLEKSRWLAEAVLSRSWRLSPRLHVDLWGNERGR